MLSSLLSHPHPTVIIAEDAEVTRLAAPLAIARSLNTNDPVGGGLCGPPHPVNRVTADLAVFFLFFHSSYGVYTSAAVAVFTPSEAVGPVLLAYERHNTKINLFLCAVSLLLVV